MDEPERPPIPLAYEPVQRVTRSLPWPARVARAAVAVGCATLPFHWLLPYPIGHTIAGYSSVVLILSGALAFIVDYYRVSLIALVGLILHIYMVL